MIAVTCFQCSRKLAAPESLAGQRARCRGCGAMVVIPFPDSMTVLTATDAEANQAIPALIAEEASTGDLPVLTALDEGDGGEPGGAAVAEPADEDELEVVDGASGAVAGSATGFEATADASPAPAEPAEADVYDLAEPNEPAGGAAASAGSAGADVAAGADDGVYDLAEPLAIEPDRPQLMNWQVHAVMKEEPEPVETLDDLQGMEYWNAWVQAAMPGFFRPLTLVLIFLGEILALVILFVAVRAIMEGMAFYGGLAAGLALVVHGQAVAWIMDGEVCTLMDILVELDERLFTFFMLMFVPFVIASGALLVFAQPDW